MPALEEIKAETNMTEEIQNMGEEIQPPKRGRFADLGTVVVEHGSPTHVSMMHGASRILMKKERGKNQTLTSNADESEDEVEKRPETDEEA